MGLRIVCTDLQAEVIRCRARFITLMAGRRWGKTFTALARMLTRSIERPIRYWYIAPTYAQAAEVYEMLTGLPELARFVKRSKAQPYPRVWLVNGSVIGLRSFDRPHTLRGSGLDEVWVDEIQDIDEQYFWPVIRPLISDRIGTLVTSGQFRGKNWQYEQLYLPGLEKGQEIYKSFRFPSSTGMVFLSPEGREELKVVKEQVPKSVWDQEYECIPAANAQAVFRHDDLSAIRRGTWRERGVPGRRYIIGLDLGRVADPSAFVVLDLDDTAVVYAELRPLGERHETGARIMETLSRKFNSALVVMDSTGGATGGRAPIDAYVNFYKKSKTPLREFIWTRNNKQRVIEQLALSVERRELSIAPECHELLEEMGLFEYEYKNGSYDYHGPKGKRDNTVAALALAYEGAERRWAASGAGVELSEVIG